MIEWHDFFTWPILINSLQKLRKNSPPIFDFELVYPLSSGIEKKEKKRKREGFLKCVTLLSRLQIAVTSANQELSDPRLYFILILSLDCQQLTLITVVSTKVF
jgi:hypothetical protein